jgi:hypothetical protein
LPSLIDERIDEIDWLSHQANVLTELIARFIFRKPTCVAVGENLGRTTRVIMKKEAFSGVVMTIASG